MSDVPNLTTEILIEIRESVRQTNAQVEHAIELFGAMWREHEEWLRDHDVKIGQLERHGRRRPGPPRRR